MSVCVCADREAWKLADLPWEIRPLAESIWAGEKAQRGGGRPSASGLRVSVRAAFPNRWVATKKVASGSCFDWDAAWWAVSLTFFL